MDGPECIYTIFDDKCKAAGITGQWASPDILSVTAFRPVLSNTKDEVSKFACKEDTRIHHLKFPFIFSEPILADFVGETCAIFRSLRSLKATEQKLDYVKISQSYRSTVRTYLEKLQDAIASGSDDTLIERHKNLITQLYYTECIWHLCEILFIDRAASGMIVLKLLEWIRFHIPQSERLATELLIHGREADAHEDYWDVVRDLILQGQVDVARALLKLHSAAESLNFQLTEQILKSMPVFNSYGGLPVQKFHSQWQYWVTDTRSKLSTGVLMEQPELETLVLLAIGDEATWSNQAKSSNCWYEYLPGFLFYTTPTCKFFELGTFAGQWLTRWMTAHGQTSSMPMKQLDRVILSVMENDMHQVLHDVQNIYDNKWFVTHLADLLHACGQLEVLVEQQQNVASELRDSLLFEYGCTLMSQCEFWPFGLDYLEHGPPEGLGAIEIHLSRLPIASDDDAEQILAAAKARGLSSIERDVCRVLAARYLASDDHGSALMWGVRSQDNIYVTSIADIILNHYCKHGVILCPDVLAHIGQKMFVSPRLVFLVKYYDFQQFYKRKEFPQAAELLINLLDSRITPEFFWPTLLADTIPLLESSDPKIPSKETTQIIHHLEAEFLPLVDKVRSSSAISGESRTPILNHSRLEDIDQLIRLLRMAAARNLARMLIIENTVL
ncbi:nuclear pore complex protein Nup75 [Phlebotomus argentipes]|uniref:nuclear pore complex protein Nup75 n=1 Tax=Phlebotomus argentipes TaxID=94469 RepID=UPI002892C31D|nr:nuclear pore complex protein Nup75 [Phlebotomus argentipes]